MAESTESTEPREPRFVVNENDWESFLREFSDRNRDRRARIEVFWRDGTTENEDEESHLETISLTGGGKNVEIIRVDRTKSEPENRSETVTNVEGIAAQYDPDGSENALEILDDQNSLVSLRFESKAHGIS